MHYVLSDSDTCVAIYPKVASMSSHSAIHTMGVKYISTERAMKCSTRIGFVRDPIERMQSVFNHFWHLTLAQQGYSKFMQPGIITAFGGILGAGESYDLEKMTDATFDQYMDTISSKRIVGESDRLLAERLNHIDYERFTDFVIGGKKDVHWRNQTKLSTHEGKQVCNKFYLFEDMPKIWKTLFPVSLNKSNAWQHIPKNVNYRINELREFYLPDYEVRGAL